jgi:hypothetical protein
MKPFADCKARCRLARERRLARALAGWRRFTAAADEIRRAREQVN